MSFWKKSNFEQLSIEIKIDKLHELNTVVGALTKRECAAGGGERLFFQGCIFFFKVVLVVKTLNIYRSTCLFDKCLKKFLSFKYWKRNLSIPARVINSCLGTCKMGMCNRRQWASCFQKVCTSCQNFTY